MAQLSDQPSIFDVAQLATELGSLYDNAHVTSCYEEFRTVCRSHPLAMLLAQDPYVSRALERPRGYAGDAVMLDYIYRPKPLLLSPIGSAIHNATTSLPNAKSILWRRDYLARSIFNCMVRVERAAVLSIACGHMREIDTLRNLTRNLNVDLFALDQDGKSIDEAVESYKEYSIHPTIASFSSLMKGKFSPRKFDFIYSAGLIDYLNTSKVISLVRSMLDHLNPHGKISVGNFTKDSHGRGFMAGFMNWNLTYRDEHDFEQIANAVCREQHFEIFRDDCSNVVYLEVYA